MAKNKISTEKGLKGKEKNFSKLANEISANLPQRSREILKKRFGLDSGEIETLEKIGNDYQITRERVRQIISDAIKKISKLSDSDVFKMAEERIILEIFGKDGIIHQEHLFEKLALSDAKEARAIIFFAACSPKIIEIENKKSIKKSFVLSTNILDKVENLIEAASDVFSLVNLPLGDDEIAEKIMKNCKEMTKNQILSFLAVSNEISKNKFGKWGFSHWMEINPKGTRERVYLVLKESKEPLHFTQIAKLIDSHGIGKKKSHPQTVHNELIKDDRFVLIGRGIYALQEWGYNSGTIKDVIKDVLKKSGKPMTKDEILKEILKLRQVKKTTVMINLNNKKEFMKQDGGYVLKK